jgi:hypothetical protein
MLSIVLPAMCHLLVYHLEQSTPLPAANPFSFDPRLAILFAGLRPSILNHPANTWYLLLRTADSLPKSSAFASVVVSPSTCMSFPLSALILHESCNTSLSKSMLNLPCSGPYILDPSTGCIRPRQSSEFLVHPLLSKKSIAISQN